jgi:stage V sporulation protein B
MTEADSRSESVAQRSTRGVAMIALAKAYFLLTGFAQPLLLTRVLGQTGYGVYGSVLNAVSILNNVVVAGSIQAMSKSVTEQGPLALRRGLVLHLIVGVALASGFTALSGPIGNGMLCDPQLPALLAIASIIVGNYSVYAALVGALNGQQRFRAQATLDMTFATLRTGLIIGLPLTVAAGPARVGRSVTGFAIASAMITVLALFVVWPNLRPARIDTRSDEPRETFGAFASKYVRFFAPVLVYQLAMNLVLQADLLVLKGLLVRRLGASAVDDACAQVAHHVMNASTVLAAHGANAVDAATSTLDRVNALVGVYKSVQNFAFLPYQMLLAVTFVVFPVVSRATFEGDRDAALRFVRGSLRFSTIAVGALLTVLVGRPEGVLRIAYRPEIAIGAGALRLLAIGQGAFAIAVITTTIVLAAGRTRAATVLMVGMLAAVFAGDYVGITFAPTDVATLDGAAAGTAVGCWLGAIAIGVYSKRVLGAFVPAATLFRCIVALALSAALIAIVPVHGKIVTLALAVVGVALYVAMIFASGEVTADERASLVRAVTKRMGR